MNAFETYAKQAQTIVDRPAKLIGAIKKRADARERYSEIVAGMNACDSLSKLEDYLFSIEPDLIQYHAELEYYWEGDGDFPGLQREIERARVRLDDGLDYPRYEERGTST